MSKQEAIQAIKYARARALFSGAESVNPANAPRRTSGSRNLKTITSIKAGAIRPFTPDCPTIFAER